MPKSRAYGISDRSLESACTIRVAYYYHIQYRSITFRIIVQGRDDEGGACHLTPASLGDISPVPWEAAAYSQ